MRELKKTAILVLMALFFTTGCGSTKTMVCTRTANQNGMEMDLRYEVEYSKSDVNVVKTTEKIKSSSPTLLETYKETIEAAYEPYKEIEHYNYNVTIEGDTLISTTEINYAEIDTDKLLKVDSANGQLIKDGKINIDDIKAAYETVGATCEK